MTTIINYFLESSVIFIVLFLFYHFSFAPYKNFNFNRVFLLFSAVFALVIPLMHFPLLGSGQNNAAPAFQQVIMLPEVIIYETSTNLAQNDGQGFRFGQVMLILYLAGFVFFATRFLMRLFKITRFINKNRDKAKDYGDYYLIPTGGRISTCSFFEYLLWDENQGLTPAQEQQIMDHETTHIRNRHSYDVVIIEILCIVFWFNPVIYFYKAALTTLHEYIADHKAAEGTSVNDYIKLLSYQTLHAMKLTLGNNFFQTQIFNRMKMLKNQKRRSWWSRLSLTIPVFALLIYVFACETDKNLVANEFTLEGFSEPYTIVSLSESPDRIKAMYNDISDKVSKENTKILRLDNDDMNKLIRTVNYKTWGFYSVGKEDLSMYAIIEKIPGYSYEAELKKPKIDENGKEFYSVVDQMPMPEGGMESFYKYVMENLRFPKDARKKRTEGKVFVEYIVNKDGKIESTKIANEGFESESLKKEALRVMNESPNWKPGLKDGEPVRVRMVLPITFKLDSKDKLEGKKEETNQKKKVQNTGDKTESESKDIMEEVVVVGQDK